MANQGAVDAAEARQADRSARTAAVREQFRHELAVAYGSHPRHVMDIYYPKQATASPVLVFLHGGGFQSGAPAAMGFVGRAVLEQGAIFVSMGYQLIPAVRFPDTCEDVELGLTWVREHIAERGGDPDRIFLSGHSAGAMLSALVGLRAWPAGTKLPDDLIKGLVLASGFYRYGDPANDVVNRDGMVNRDSKRYVPNLIDALQRVPAQTILLAGEYDYPAALPDAKALTEAIKARGGSAELFVVPNADHFATPLGLATPGSPAAEAAIRMMRLG